MTARNRRRRPCFHTCIDGRQCTLENDPAAPHEHHICDDPRCVCHSPAAYGLALVTVRGSAEYRRLPESEAQG